eukprot:TRINITY_DN2544_c0_g1_i1.p2 TRINITY_DN2544_c0_g1~~TRINITY_DN2544_c0_g1_i1.p2  ORF type:complete len:204 (-),score=35.39 TRINITY_DN2544_c0_g1_i1:500-1111(-)
MSYWTALLLLFLSEELVFWVMRAVINTKLPLCYYTASMSDIVVDIHVFKLLLNEKMPRVAQHLDMLDVSVGVVIPQWFLTLFCGSLPPDSKLRVLDCFLYEGDKVLFRVAFALFAMNQKKIMATTQMEDLIRLLCSLPKLVVDPKMLLRYAFNLTFSRQWLTKMRQLVCFPPHPLPFSSLLFLPLLFLFISFSCDRQTCFFFF